MRHTLLNPKLAGLHRPVRYAGYRAGRRAPTHDAGVSKRDDLVPCQLPALISQAQYRAILDRVMNS